MTREETIRHFKIMEIMDLVLKINGVKGGRNYGPTAFFDFVGHVGSVVVYYYENWTKEEPDWRMTAYIDCPEELEVIFEHLLKILHENEKSS